MPKLAALRGNTLEEAALQYQQDLDLAIPYLEARGIDQRTAEHYRLGVVNTPYSGHDFYRGRLAIPYLAPAGVVTIRFRALEEGQKPKYLGMPKQETIIYNVAALQTQQPYIVICEGELDTIIVQENAGLPATGLSGVSQWKPLYGRLYEHFDRVLILGDGDEAGRLMSQSLCDELDNAVAVQMPDGLDATDFCLLEGPQELASLLRSKL